MSGFEPLDFLDLKKNPDGSYTRLLTIPTCDPNPEGPIEGDRVLSKDVIINPETNTSIRIFLPAKPISTNPSTRLPIIFYFHGCYWVRFRANNPALHRDREKFASAIPAIILLVDYRLAPEFRLPAQYKDAEDAILWLKKQAIDPDGEKWLKDYGDFMRCFLFGSSNGGNIIFHAALRAIDLELSPIKLRGLIFNQPLFGGKKRTKSEVKYATDQMMPLPAQDLVWELTLPEGVDRDHRYCNPFGDEEGESRGIDKSKLKFLPRSFVVGFGMDPLIDRQQEFVSTLLKNGAKVDCHFEDVGFHRIELVDPRRMAALLSIFKMFINSFGSQLQIQQ